MVSVIIPNYNHALYLPQRITSVLNQTFQDFEILLLDDCSQDDSHAVIAEYAARDSRIKVILNEQNSGSTFKQWNKGIALAKGEYVWLAESDDYAHPEFLSTLVALLDADQRVGLAYCNSYSVDEKGDLMPEHTWEPFLAELDAQLWKCDFSRSGLELVRRFMSYRNIVPNASAVLLRRSTLLAVGPADESYRLLGDWVFWAKIMAVSHVAYVTAPLNFFRTHRNNVRSRTTADGTALVETTRRLSAMKQYGQPDAHFYRLATELLLAVWFHSAIYHNVSREKHVTIYRNMLLLDPGFRRHLLSKLRQFLFQNNLSGVRMLLGDKLLRSFRKQQA